MNDLGERSKRGERRRETGEGGGGERGIGALRLLVSKLVCQVSHVCCVENEVLRLRGRECVLAGNL